MTASPHDTYVSTLELAVRGKQIELEQIKSPTVRMLVEKATANGLEALRDLIDADAADIERIRRLQGAARQFRDMIAWIDEEIEGGAAAAEALEAIHDGDDDPDDRETIPDDQATE